MNTRLADLERDISLSLAHMCPQACVRIEARAIDEWYVVVNGALVGCYPTWIDAWIDASLTPFSPTKH